MENLRTLEGSYWAQDTLRQVLGLKAQVFTTSDVKNLQSVGTEHKVVIES